MTNTISPNLAALIQEGIANGTIQVAVTLAEQAPAIEAKPESAKAKKAREKAEAKAAAEQAAKKAEREAAGRAFVEGRKARKNFRIQLAAALREEGIVPSGQAWEIAKDLPNGFFDDQTALEQLRALNVEDGLKMPAAKVEGTVEVKPSKTEKAKAKSARKSAAAKEAAEAKARNEKGQFVKAVVVVGDTEIVMDDEDEAETVRNADDDGFSLFAADLRDFGLTDVQILAAWEMRDES